jgi:hypothetical protein
VSVVKKRVPGLSAVEAAMPWPTRFLTRHMASCNVWPSPQTGSGRSTGPASWKKERWTSSGWLSLPASCVLLVLVGGNGGHAVLFRLADDWEGGHHSVVSLQCVDGQVVVCFFSDALHVGGVFFC